MLIFVFFSNSLVIPYLIGKFAVEGLPGFFALEKNRKKRLLVVFGSLFFFSCLLIVS